MTRDHAPKYEPPADAFASLRCSCGHIVYEGQTPGEDCLLVADGLCGCSNHWPAHSSQRPGTES